MAYDFPSPAVLGQVYQSWIWDGEKWASMTFVPSQAVTKYKNYIINGGMQVSQENGSTVLATVGHPVDLFYFTGALGVGAWTQSQVASRTFGGSTHRIRLTVTTVDTTIAAGTALFYEHCIEGLRMADLNAGGSNAKTITLQFGVKAPAGTYCVSFRNSATNRSYIAEYVITAGEANTDRVKSVTVPMDTAGVWIVDNGKGISIDWILMCGSNFRGAPNTWVATNALASSNQFNFFGTVGNTFELFDVSLTEGSTAPPFQLPDYATELAACRRYFEVWDNTVGGLWTPVALGTAISATTADTVFNYALKRTTPTMFYSSGAHFALTSNIFGPANGCNSLSSAYANPQTMQLRGVTTGGFTAGQPCALVVNTNNLAKIFLNARL